MTSIRALRRCLRDTAGATAIEYALLAALIATVIVAAVGATGRSVAGLYSGTNDKIASEIAKSSTL